MSCRDMHFLIYFIMASVVLKQVLNYLMYATFYSLSASYIFSFKTIV